MKIRLNTNLIINILIIGFIALEVANFSSQWLFRNYGTSQQGIDTLAKYRWENNLKPIDATIPDSISHWKYIKLTDSVKEIRKIKNGEYPFDGGASIGNLISTTGCLNCDNCDIKQFQKIVFDNSSKADIRYYINLMGWKINNSKNDRLDRDSVQFFVEHGQSYIRKIIDIPKAHITRVVDTPVKFRYDPRDQSLLIPVTKSTKQTLGILLTVVVITLLLYVFYLLAQFLKFIVDLSKGLSFTSKNVKRLRLIALSFLIYPVALFLFNFLLRLIFHSYFTSDVILKNDLWDYSWKIIVVGIVFLLLWKAFRQGKRLKEEQELTV